MSEAPAEKLADNGTCPDRGRDNPSQPREGSGFSSGVQSIPLPRVFGRLLLLKLLARGGMGDVYLAATTGIEGAERPIVVKTVRRDHIHDGSFLARFLDEARVQSQLHHPGVVQILEASTDENGEPYTVVEYVEGRSLADLRHRAVQMGAHIGWPEAVAIAIEMGQALAHVHERAGADGTPLGIVHRDLSPQNVMIGYAGDVKLIDFGTARGHNRRCHTVAGVVFAKPGYVAPEVARQQVGDGRIDVYAVGVMLWELCAGKRLLSGDPHVHLEDVAAGKFEIPRLAKTRGIPAEIDDVIQKLCANDPDDRYSSSEAAATDLARILAQAPAGKDGERSTRARIGAVMKTLWPNEPARARAEFAKLLRQARALKTDPDTPPASSMMLAQAERMTSDPSILPGTPYRLLAKIGEGASGEVFEAEHVELGRTYAVKVLSTAHAAGHDAASRFRREARVIAKLSHPNVVALHDFGKSLDGRVFLAMERLSGTTLDVHAAEKALPWREVIRVGVQVTNALEAAHAAGLVHRDLKPQNLFLTEAGDIKLLDFGVAMALAEAGEREPQKGFAVFGTPEYMAPEQATGEDVDGRCDIYALGCVLYELATGHRPFEGSPVVVMGKQIRETADRPTHRAPQIWIPRELEEVILKALSKAKEDRYADAAAMREALSSALRLPDQRRARARRAAALVFASALGVLAAAGFQGRLARVFSAAKPVAMATAVTVQSLPEAPAEPAAVATLDEGLLPAPPPTGLPANTEPSPEPELVAVSDKPSTPRAPMARPVKAQRPEAIPALPRPAASGRSASGGSATAQDEAKKSLLVQASLRSSEDAKAKLGDARSFAREKPRDPRALKGWATAALQAGELREARRAAEAWAVHDAGAEARFFLAATLEAGGRKREARAVLEEWLANHPDSSEAKKLLARLGAVPEPAIKRSAPRGRRVD